MFQEFLAKSQHLDWPLAAFVLFFLVFIGVIVHLGRGLIKKKSYDHIASLPLEDDETVNREGGSPR
jgi:cbb3-type cytochrome oxidase subunit 3